VLSLLAASIAPVQAATSCCLNVYAASRYIATFSGILAGFTFTSLFHLGLEYRREASKLNGEASRMFEGENPYATVIRGLLVAFGALLAATYLFGTLSGNNALSPVQGVWDATCIGGVLGIAIVNLFYGLMYFFRNIVRFPQDAPSAGRTKLHQAFDVTIDEFIGRWMLGIYLPMLLYVYFGYVFITLIRVQRGPSAAFPREPAVYAIWAMGLLLFLFDVLLMTKRLDNALTWLWEKLEMKSEFLHPPRDSYFSPEIQSLILFIVTILSVAAVVLSEEGLFSSSPEIVATSGAAVVFVALVGMGCLVRRAVAQGPDDKHPKPTAADD
jgi:hypothetical protein